MSYTRHLILGGTRSGKSAYAEKIAKALSQQKNTPLIYIATATAVDDEMQQRIQRRQQGRQTKDWLLLEESLDLANSVDGLTQQSVVLIDCLTVWLNNCLYQSDDTWHQQKQAFISQIQQCQHDILLVSNEVGQGIVPMGKASRRFVDEIGWLHQTLAQHCDRVTLLIAGLPQTLK